MSPLRQSKSFISNRILAALPADEYKLLLPKLKPVVLSFGESIYEKGEIIRNIYFLNSGIISLLGTIEKSATLEVGIVGNEGIAGISVFLGVESSLYRAVVQSKGLAMRMPSEDFLKACEKGGMLPRLLRRFTGSLLAQISQSAICCRFHPVQSRFARWLLMTSDRMRSLDFEITQIFMSQMLGVRREAINKAAAIFQEQQLIRYVRGYISITDFSGLEKAACRCYDFIKAEERSYPVKPFKNPQFI